MFNFDLAQFHNKVGHIWVAGTRVSGLINWLDKDVIQVTDLQVPTLVHTVNAGSIEMVTVDSNLDTKEKFDNMKAEQEAKQKAAAEEYKKQAEELAKAGL